MASKRIIKAAELFEPIQVDLWGTAFRVREPTRTLEEKSGEAQRKLDEVAEEAQESDISEAESRKRLLPLFYEALDLMLEPTGDGKVHAKTVLKEQYEKDKIGLAHIQALVWEIARVARREDDGQRPT